MNVLLIDDDMGSLLGMRMTLHSGYSDQRREAECLKRGAVAVLKKPLDAGELASILNTISVRE